MRIIVTPGTATGIVAAPPSKSMAHRLLICAGLAEGESIIHGLSDCEDVKATLDCLQAMGAVCENRGGGTVSIRGIDALNCRPSEPLRCRESGSTLRFLIPTLLLCGRNATFTGYGRLMERPMTVYERLCSEQGFRFFREGNILTVGGRLQAGVYRLAGNVSSQFISGLLFALPLCEKDSAIELVSSVESRSYIALTLDALQQFGVRAYWENEKRLCIPGGQRYQPREVRVEGDYSNAAFLDALSGLGGQVEVTGLRADSLQGDRVYRSMMESLDVSGEQELSLADCPDLGPVLFAYAAAKNGGIFTDTRRLRIKESDRVAAMRQELSKLGVTLLADENRVEIPKTALQAPKQPLEGHNDHRIVMALTLLLTLTGGELEGAEAVKKSYPNFFSELRALGVTIQEEI